VLFAAATGGIGAPKTRTGRACHQHTGDGALLPSDAPQLTYPMRDITEVMPGQLINVMAR
jgi:hypothetical protein